MGLAERRAAKDFETHRFPQLKMDAMGKEALKTRLENLLESKL